MNRKFFSKRVKITKNKKVIRRASNTAHTTSSDSSKTKNRRKTVKNLHKTIIKSLSKIT